MPGERLALQEDLALFPLDRFPYVPMDLVNNTSVDLSIGDVVAISTTDARSVEEDEHWRSTRRFVVAMEPILRGLPGRFCAQGFCLIKTGGFAVNQGVYFEKNDGFALAGTSPRSVTGTSTPVEQGVTPPRFALGYSTESAPGTGLLVDAYFYGVASEADNPRYDVTVRDDFVTLNSGGVAPATGALVPASHLWWWLGANPATDQAANGLGGVGGDATTPGSMYLSRDGTANISLVVISTASPVMRMRWAQKSATAANRFIGAMSAFTGAAPTNGVYVRHTAGGNLTGVCRSGGVESTLDLAVAAAAGTYHTVEMRWRGTAAVDFYVNGSYVGQITGNIPTAALGFGAAESIATPANVGMIIDRMECLLSRV